MKISIFTLGFILFIFLYCPAQNNATLDSLTKPTSKKEISEQKKSLRKTERKNFKQHFRLATMSTLANINSSLRFETPRGLLSAKIDFEQNLGMESKKIIYSGTFIYRITPRSGLYASYYRLDRKKNFELNEDISFKGDTLKKGLLLGGYFNTNVLSVGYLLSLLNSDKSFLGAYLNMYVIKISAGIKSDAIQYNESTALLAPLPNFGLLASFNLKKWLTLSGGIGIFFLNSEDMSGSFHDVNAAIQFNPAKWLGIVVGYNVFDVKIAYPVQDFMAYAEYSFSGPSFGLNFRF